MKIDDKSKPAEPKKITFRGSNNFGFILCNNLIEQLNKENVPPSKWPIRFPITIKQIKALPEIDDNNKVANKAVEAARVIWKDLREEAMEIELDMKLHPEFYEEIDEINTKDHMKAYTWRHLSVNIEQVAGELFITEFADEDIAKKSVYSKLKARQLKNFMIIFDDDYKVFIDEIREVIRASKNLMASERFELICLLNVESKKAEKLVIAEKRKKAA